MNNYILEIRRELEQLADLNYKNFSSTLIPNVDNIIGVRIPHIHKIAKKISKTNWQEYFKYCENIYFEETMLTGFVIGYMNTDINIVIQKIKWFIPQINNWSVCDSFCSALKIVKTNKELFWNFLIPYTHSYNAYDIRFAVVIIIKYYIDIDYLDKIFEICNYIKHEDYYVKMAVAWLVSMCFVKFQSQTLKYLQNNNDIDDFTYNKSLQKIIESLKVEKNTKDFLKSIKR